MMNRNALISICMLLGAVVMLSSCAPKPAVLPRVEPMNVYCLGDSITSGYKMADPARQSYPAQLQRMSQYKWKVTNGGVPGATLLKKGNIPIWTQPAYTGIEAAAPDLVIVILGTNDTKDRNWQYIDEFPADLEELVAALKALPTRPQVYLSSLPPILIDYPGGMTNARASLLTRKVESVALATGTPYIRLHEQLKGGNHLFIDGLHPNVQGARVIAETVLRTVAGK